MLTKNVYIIYPAGYSGSYINWAINISDADLMDSTVKDPINPARSDKFGGAGTSHLHTRIPTHQGLDAHIAWTLLNQPQDKRVYIINSATENTHTDIYLVIRQIVQYDPTGVFISIHNDGDELVGAYGTINCITKWPIYIEGMLSMGVTMTESVGPADFNAYDCADDIKFRNWVVNNGPYFFRQNYPLDKLLVDEHAASIGKWFTVRHNKNPHEVNESMYIPNVDMRNRLFELSCQSIASDSFPQWLEDFLTVSRVSDNFDTDYIKEFHHNYIAAQNNLRWFDSIKLWSETGLIDDYLTSHSGIEAQLILHIFKLSGRINSSNKDSHLNWLLLYNNIKADHWPKVQTELDFFRLPEYIQAELIQSGYTPCTSHAILEIVDLKWESLSVHDINEVYQRHKNKTVKASQS